MKGLYRAFYPPLATTFLLHVHACVLVRTTAAVAAAGTACTHVLAAHVSSMRRSVLFSFCWARAHVHAPPSPWRLRVCSAWVYRTPSASSLHRLLLNGRV